ncbi:hypothetical protein RRG08_037194 [Elysia crispata]|uniref:Uncharacterized protein n=1 Tax=Elysia crispata TaxID=231223 RepID=A0AAE0Z3I9_9GAST|nr:hypothetical protein RRG08_037194 [Elysia crispata]
MELSPNGPRSLFDTSHCLTQVTHSRAYVCLYISHFLQTASGQCLTQVTRSRVCVSVYLTLSPNGPRSLFDLADPL